MNRTTLVIATALAILAGPSLLLTGCTQSDADVAAKNISKAAEQFEVLRRIVFINGITDKYLLAIEGYCSVETSESALGGSIEVTCRTGQDKAGRWQFKKSFLGLSDNVTYMVEQIDPINVSTTHYRVIFKPEAIVPDFDRP